MRFSTLESLWFVGTIRCINDILSPVHALLTPSKAFTAAWSSRPIAFCARHQNRRVKKGIHRQGKWETFCYTSKRSYSRLQEMRRQDGMQDTIWMIEWLAHRMASSGMWNASPQLRLSYTVSCLPCVLVWSSSWHTVSHPSSNIIPGSTNSTSSGRWCLHIMAALDSTSHIARWCKGVGGRWKHTGAWLFQISWWLFEPFGEPNNSHHRSPIVHHELSVISSYVTVLVPDRSHNRVHGESCGAVS